MNSVKWELTQRCNLKCRHCFVGKINYENDIEIDKAREMLQIIKESGATEVVLSTKEPLAYTYICELLESCAELDLYVTIVTNGTLLSDRLLKCLSLCKIKNFSVSLEGISIETNDYVRGEGVFTKVIDAVKCVNELNYTKKYFFPLALQISLTTKNYCEVKDMIEWFENSPFVAVNIGDIAIIGNAKNNKDLKLSEEQYEKAVDVLLEGYSKINAPSFALNLKKSTPFDTIYYNMKYGLAMECVVPSCSAYHGYYSLLPNGDTCSCVALKDEDFASYDNLKSNYNLLRDRLFEDKTRIMDLGKYKEDGFCKQCKYSRECELCLLIVYDEEKLTEARKKCKKASKLLEKELENIYLGIKKYRLNPYVFVYEFDEKMILKKIGQTGVMNELDVTSNKESIRYLFLNSQYISIDSMPERKLTDKKKLIKKLMYNDMLQISRGEE